VSTANLLAILAVIGSLTGVFIGAWLASHWQRRHWVLDNKKAEYREVLDLLATYRFRLVSYIASYTPPPGGIVAYDPRDRFNERNRFDEVQVSLSNALADSLFIRKELAKRNVRERFEEFVRGLDTDTSSPAPPNPQSTNDIAKTFVGRVARATTELASLHQTVVLIADEDLGLKK
jgi:hypothetical protein